jgi:release factor glutamine methyltransferase
LLAARNSTVAETLNAGARRLAESGIDNPRLESRLLLAHAIGSTSEDLIRDLHRAIDAPDFDRLVARRSAREPLAYILGWREFWSLKFHVSPATLIPRPESETVVEAALRLVPNRRAPVRVLDLGTGTGCLLLAFLHERDVAFGIGTDRSTEAARLARGNAANLGLADRSAFLCGNWDGALNARFDLVLSNPPYVATPDLARLMPDVAEYEPSTALDGGVDGLTAYRAILDALPRLLAPGGSAVLELGLGQYDAVATLAAEAGLRAGFTPDLAGIPRAMILRPTP